MVVVRQAYSTPTIVDDKYLITGCFNTLSNDEGSDPINGNATFSLNSMDLTVPIRRQGSTYIFDNSDPSERVFWQLDAWHESTHPEYWKKDFDFEAEVMDNIE